MSLPILDYSILYMHASEAALKSLNCLPFSFKVQMPEALLITVISVIKWLIALHFQCEHSIVCKKLYEKYAKQFTFLKLQILKSSAGETRIRNFVNRHRNISVLCN